jgi:hypothetical protein
MALVTRIEVLNQHECHAGIVRQMAEQLRERLQAAGGGAYANNGGGTAFGAFLSGRPRDNAAENGITGLLCHTQPPITSPKWASSLEPECDQ